LYDAGILSEDQAEAELEKIEAVREDMKKREKAAKAKAKGPKKVRMKAHTIKPIKISSKRKSVQLQSLGKISFKKAPDIKKISIDEISRAFQNTK
jgi:hypothetical protein